MADCVTKEQAIEAALGEMLASSELGEEGATLTVCNCNRLDLESMSDDARSKVMDACLTCTRIVIPAGGGRA